MRLTGHGDSFPDRPVRVCFVIDRLSCAGTETQLLALIKNLNRDAVEPSLCLLNGDDPESKSLLSPDCPTIDLKLRRLIGLSSFAAAVRLIAFWRQQRVDVVQTYFLDSSYFAIPLARLCGIGRVVRVRNNAGYWVTPRLRFMERLVGRLGHTITNSDAAKQKIMKSERLAADRVTVIENGVDLDRFPSIQPPDTRRAAVRIGAVANLRPVKNIDGLVRVAASISAKYPSVRFHVAGDGEQRVALESQIRSMGLEGRFHLRGTVTQIPDFLASLDIAVLSSHSESMSNALLEYMAAGRAIVATDVGAASKLVQHGREGLIVPPGDERGLEQAITTYLTDPTLARRCGEAARRRVMAEFSRAQMVQRFEQFFRVLVRKKSPRRIRGPLSNWTVGFARSIK